MNIRYIFSPIAASALITLAATSSCIRTDGKAVWPFHETIDGQGAVISDVRNLGPFDAVDLDGSYAVVLTQAEGPTTVTVHTNKNLLPHVITKVSNGKLIVSTDADLRPTDRIQVEISAPDYKSVDVAGSSDVKASTPLTANSLHLGIAGSGSYDLEVRASELASEIEGSGHIALHGSAKDHTIEIDGSGQMIADALETETSHVDVAGSGDAKIFVKNDLDVSIAGSGTVRYKGGAKTVHNSISGSGNVAEMR